MKGLNIFRSVGILPLASSAGIITLGYHIAPNYLTNKNIVQFEKFKNENIDDEKLEKFIFFGPFSSITYLLTSIQFAETKNLFLKTFCFVGFVNSAFILFSYSLMLGYFNRLNLERDKQLLERNVESEINY